MSAGEANGVSQALPWIVAIIGWGFTHLFSEARERRKEVRAQLDKAIEIVLTIEKSGRAFHIAPSFDASKAAELRLAIDILERKFHRISCLEVDQLNTQLIAFRRSITLRNFEASEFTSQPAESEIFADISGSAFGLEDALECQYLSRYPRTFPYFKFGKS